MNWYPVELHTHTQHSDGDFSVRALVEAAQRRGFAAIACTDHNTVSGLPELTVEAEQNELVPIPGIEWTTYWGHMLVLGEQGYTDWRGIKPSDIDQAITAIHANHGLVGIAHPLAISSPVKTGYHWEFLVNDWDAVDFMEVWSRDRAPVKVQSYRAMQLWEQLLNRGCHITATSGRDWHREDRLPYAHTYIGTDGILSTENIFTAIRQGCVCLSTGPLLTMKGRQGNVTLDIGDTAVPGSLEITWALQAETMQQDWDASQIVPEEVHLIHNGEVIYRCSLPDHQPVTLAVSEGWLRADLIGRFYEKERQIIALTNPIFVRSDAEYRLSSRDCCRNRPKSAIH